MSLRAPIASHSSSGPADRSWRQVEATRPSGLGALATRTSERQQPRGLSDGRALLPSQREAHVSRFGASSTPDLQQPEPSSSVVPNSSFKPKLLRSGKYVAGRACHVFACATQFGLTQVLGAK